MTILWVILATLPPGYHRPPYMVVERFSTEQECRRVLAIFPRERFECLPSLTIGGRV